MNSISFQTFFVQAFKIGVDSWTFNLLLLYILWDDWPIFMISDSNEQLQQQLEYTLLKPDCHSWWISKMQSGHERERYAIKLYFKLGKTATETYGMLQTAFEASCMNRASVFEWHRLICWGYKGVQEEIPWEEASTLQIGSVAFLPGHCTSPQLHTCHKLFDQDRHQHSSSTSL